MQTCFFVVAAVAVVVLFLCFFSHLLAEIVEGDLIRMKQFVIKSPCSDLHWSWCRINVVITTWKVSVFRLFLVCIFTHSYWIWRNTFHLSVISQSECGKIQTRKTSDKGVVTNNSVFHYHVLSGQVEFLSYCFHSRNATRNDNWRFKWHYWIT